MLVMLTEESANVAIDGDGEDDLWACWDRIAEMYNNPSLVAKECYHVAVGETANPAMPAQAGDCGGRVPVMPRRTGMPRSHRDKVQGPFDSQIYAALAARPVGRAEIAAKPMGAKATNFEWDRLRGKTVWDEDHPCDWYDVKQEALREYFDVHLRHLAGICVEKNSEMQQEYRKYKGRVVLFGNAVVDQHHDVATFGGLGSSPATLEAAKAVDFYCCLPGHVVEVADGEQAYVQAEMKGYSYLGALASRSEASMGGKSTIQECGSRCAVCSRHCTATRMLVPIGKSTVTGTRFQRASIQLGMVGSHVIGTWR